MHIPMKNGAKTEGLQKSPLKIMGPEGLSLSSLFSKTGTFTEVQSASL